MLYNIKGEVPDEEYLIPIGKADLKREGDHCSIITSGKMVLVAHAGGRPAREGGHQASTCVDLRTIRPMDVDAIAASREEDQSRRGARGGLGDLRHRRADRGLHPARLLRRSRRAGGARAPGRHADAVREEARARREARRCRRRSRRSRKSCTSRPDHGDQSVHGGALAHDGRGAPREVAQERRRRREERRRARRGRDRQGGDGARRARRRGAAQAARERGRGGAGGHAGRGDRRGRTRTSRRSWPGQRSADGRRAAMPERPAAGSHGGTGCRAAAAGAAGCRAVAAPAASDFRPPPASVASGRPAARLSSPLARRLADERGLDLAARRRQRPRRPHHQARHRSRARASAPAPAAPPASAGFRRRLRPRLRGRPAHPDPQDDREAPRRVHRPDPHVLPHRRVRPPARAARCAPRWRRWATSTRCRSTTSS